MVDELTNRYLTSLKLTYQLNVSACNPDGWMSASPESATSVPRYCHCQPGIMQDGTLRVPSWLRCHRYWWSPRWPAVQTACMCAHLNWFGGFYIVNSQIKISYQHPQAVLSTCLSPPKSPIYSWTGNAIDQMPRSGPPQQNLRPCGSEINHLRV
jgi:hypothetical protein